MGIYDKDKSISRRELKRLLRRDNGRIGNFEGKYSQREREKLGENTFGPKYGSEISRKDYRDAIRGLKKERSAAKDIKSREIIDDKIKYLKKIGGNKI